MHRPTQVALVTEDAYPYQDGDLTSWCEDLVGSLDEVTYHVVAITAGRPESLPTLPPNVEAVTTVPIWTAPGPGAAVPVTRDADAIVAAALLCRGLLGESRYHFGMFRTGLRALVLSGPYVHPMTGVPLPAVLADAWNTSQPARLPAADADAAATALAHALHPLAVPLPPADLSHAVDAGLAGLAALASKWRDGTPILLSEQSLYLHDRSVEFADGIRAATKTTLLGFFRALTRVLYREAALIAPFSTAFRRWELDYGAHPATIVPVPPGAEPSTFRLLYADVRASRGWAAGRVPMPTAAPLGALPYPSRVRPWPPAAEAA